MSRAGSASLDHYSKGAVLEWVFRVMCGVGMDGENHFIIVPRPGGHFDHAGLIYNSIYGQVESGWRKVNGNTVYSFSIPTNCTAKVILPGRETQKFSSGVYQIETQPDLA